VLSSPTLSMMGGETVASSSNDLLRQMFETMPRESRIAFLREILATLTDAERRVLLDGLGHAGRAVVPEVGAPRIEVADQVEEDKTLSEDQKKLIIDKKMQMLISQQSFETGGKDRMRRQMWSCMGLILLGGVLLVVLAYGSKEVFDWLLALFGEPGA